MKLSERLRELREEKNLSQMELANLTGISQSAIARWELEKTEPTASAIILLAGFYEVSCGYLLGVED